MDNLAMFPEMGVAESGLPDSQVHTTISFSNLRPRSNTIKSNHFRFRSTFLKVGLATPFVLEEMENMAEEP